jgi:hypothetical protein
VTTYQGQIRSDGWYAMVGVLSGAVIVLTAMVMLNLAVTVAVIRRLRELAGQPGESVNHAGPEPGSRLPDFAAEALDGTPVRSADLVGKRTVLAFFSTSCSACRAKAPDYAARAASLEDSGDVVITILQTAPGDNPAAMIAALERAGTLIVQPFPAPLMRTFMVRATPFFYLTDQAGRVASKGISMDAALAPAVRG